MVRELIHLVRKLIRLVRKHINLINELIHLIRELMDLVRELIRLARSNISVHAAKVHRVAYLRGTRSQKLSFPTLKKVQNIAFTRSRTLSATMFGKRILSHIVSASRNHVEITSNMSLMIGTCTSEKNTIDKENPPTKLLSPGGCPYEWIY